jgi:hypothetical protein
MVFKKTRRKKMKKLGVVAVLILFLFPLESNAETSRAVRLGIGTGVFSSLTRADGGGDFTLNVSFERYTPFELEMGYFIARGGIEIILLIDVYRSRHLDWHLFDFGLYFPLGTQPFSNLDLDRRFDIIIGTGLDIPIPQLPNAYITLNLRFFVPDPDRIGRYAKDRGAEVAQGIAGRLDWEALQDLDAFADREFDGVFDAYKDGFRDVFRDVGLNMIFMVGFKYYFLVFKTAFRPSFYFISLLFFTKKKIK